MTWRLGLFLCAATLAIAWQLPSVAAQVYPPAPGTGEATNIDSRNSPLELPPAPTTAAPRTEHLANAPATSPTSALPHCTNCEDQGRAMLEATLPGADAYEEQNQDFDPDVRVSSIGLAMRQDRRQLKSGDLVNGLLIVGVEPGSPAANAGLQPHRDNVRAVTEIAVMGAAMVFPPAMVGLAIINGIQFGESYDMIIGIDGERVSNFLAFEDRMRSVHPGDIVYFNVVRNGTRLQVPVTVPLHLAVND